MYLTQIWLCLVFSKIIKVVWYMANIPRLRAILKHNAMRKAWQQPLALVYWQYTTNTRGALLLFLTGYNLIRAVKNTCFVIPVVYNLIHHSFQPISIQGWIHPVYNMFYIMALLNTCFLFLTALKVILEHALFPYICMVEFNGYIFYV